MNKKLISAFTLIELLMVISIITLISSIFFSYMGTASAKSRDSVRLSDMKQINTAAMMYYEDKGDVPSNIDVLVSTGYLSSVPVDPKTKEGYKFYSTTTSNGKKIFTASATYEKIYTLNSDGQEIPQQVGVVVTDSLTISDICILIKAINDPQIIDYPNCDDANTSNDQIIGSTNGHRSRSSGSSEENIISNCSQTDINLSCPSPMVDTLCYCGGGLNNGFVPPSSVWEPYECKNLGGEFNLPDSCIFSDVTSNDCVSVGGTVISGTDYQCSIYTYNSMDGNIP